MTTDTPNPEDEDCKHGLPPFSCTLCKYGLTIPPVYAEYFFKARFSGQCEACALEYEPGDLIWKCSDGSYVHDGCEPQLIPRKTGLEVSDD